MSTFGDISAGVTWPPAFTNTLTVDLTGNSVSTKGIVVKGVSGQTGNLAEFTDNTNAVKCRVLADGSIAFASNSADSGIVRLPNNTYIRFRDQANASNILALGVDTSNNILIGAGSNGVIISKNLAIADGDNMTFATGTGTKIGTATNEKFAFWNKTPNVQPTTAITASTFTANTGTAVNDASTFGGYTLGKVVAALIRVGILA